MMKLNAWYSLQPLCVTTLERNSVPLRSATNTEQSQDFVESVLHDNGSVIPTIGRSGGTPTEVTFARGEKVGNASQKTLI